MKAAVLEHVDAPLVVAEVGLTDLTPGQVLVKVLVSGICGAQLLEIGGHKGNAPYMPHLLGHEGVGLVEEVGPQVTKVKKGDKVVMHWRKGSGIEADFPNYVYKSKKMPSGKVTTFSEYSIVSENRLTPVQADIPNDFYALLGCGLSTALGTMLDEAKVQPGENVMIVGFGGLGASLLKAARLAKAGKIIIIDIFEDKREMAMSIGADLFVNSSSEDIVGEMQKTLGLKDVNVIVETSGNPKSLSNTLPLLAPSGRYILVGQPKTGESFEVKNANHLFGGEGKTIKATQGGGFKPDTDIPRYVELLKNGVLNIEGLVTQRTTLENINQAIELMKSGKANRIMIDIWP